MARSNNLTPMPVIRIAVTTTSWALGGLMANGYRGKVVEITADRTSRQFAARGEISFVLKVSGNTFGGMASATFFDAGGRRIRGPVQSEWRANGYCRDRTRPKPGAC
jgi:hypothetical protein